MIIRDKAVIIKKQGFKENDGIITVLTQNHGICKGLVKNITGKNSAIYQVGNIVDFMWNARIREHIGIAKCELEYSSAHFMLSKSKIYALNSILSVILLSFKEHVPYKNFFIYFTEYIKSSSGEFSFMQYVTLEASLLRDAGYGLNLSKCAATGSNKDLEYVSPKSGMAVSRQAGYMYKDKLLKLPRSLIDGTEPRSREEITQVSNMFLYFLQRYIFGKYEPLERKLFIEHLTAL